MQGLTSSHSIPAGSYGLSPAELRRVDPLGIGPSSRVVAVLPPVSGAERSRPVSRRDRGVSVRGAGRQHVPHLHHAASTVGSGQSQNLFGRLNFQDDAQQSSPQFDGLPSNTVTAGKNWGTAIGWDATLSSDPGQHVPLRLHPHRHTNLGLRTGNLTSFRFIDTPDGQTSTNGRLIDTNNIINDLTWLKGRHTLKTGANLRFVRNSSFTNANSFITGIANASWTSGVGRPLSAWRRLPGAGELQRPAGGREHRAVVVRRLADPDPRRHQPDQRRLQLHDRRRRDSVRRAAAPALWRGRIRVLPPGQLARQRHADADRRPALQPVLAAVGNQRPAGRDQLQPRRLVRSARRQHGGRHPVERERAHHVPARRQGERRARLLRVGQEQLRAAARGGVDAHRSLGRPRRLRHRLRPHRRRPGDDVRQRRVVRAVERSRFAVRRLRRDSRRVRFVNPTAVPATYPAAPPAGFPAEPETGAGAIALSIDDSVRTPYAHSFNVAVARELGSNFAVEGAYVGRRGRNLASARHGDADEPDRPGVRARLLRRRAPADRRLRRQRSATSPASRGSPTGRTSSRVRPAAA